MSTPVRYPNGVTNVSAVDPLNALTVPDPTQLITFFDDFNTYAAADWVITTTELGTGSATEVSTAGALILTNAAGDNDLDFLQLSSDGGTTVSEPFLFTSGKQMWFESRFKLSDVSASSAVMGLQIADTTPLAVTDGVFFLVDDTEGDGTVSLVVEKNSTETTVADVATLTDDTYVVLSYHYDGDSAIKVYVDGAYKGSAATTNLPDDEQLTVSFGVQNGAAAAKVMTIDYIFVAQER